MVNGDGCSGTCEIEKNWSCQNEEGETSECKELNIDEELLGAITSSVSYAMGAMAGVQAVTQGGSPALWSMVNSYQVMLTLVLFKTFIPRSIGTLLEGNSFSTFSFELAKQQAPVLFSWGKLDTWVAEIEPPEVQVPGLKVAGFDTGSVLLNQITLLQTLSFHCVLWFLALPLIISLRCCRKKKKMNSIQNFVKVVSSYFHFTLLVRVFFEASLWTTITATLEVFTIAEIPSVASYSYACFNLILLILFTVLIPLHSCCYRRKP